MSGTSSSSLLSDVCEDIRNIVDATDMSRLSSIAERCAHHLEHVHVILDTLDAALMHAASADGRNCGGDHRDKDARLLALWFLLDKLCKQHVLFVDSIRHRLLDWATRAAPSRTNGANDWWPTFLLVLDSLKIFFGSSLIALIKLKCDPTMVLRAAAEQGRVPSADGAGTSTSAVEEPVVGQPSRALVQHSTQLRSIGGFTTKQSNSQRSGPQKSALQVRTVDSLMAMSVASAYAPARPVEIQVTIAAKDSDAPLGYMQALPENHQVDYEAQRKKRLREVLERNRLDDDRKARERLLMGAAAFDGPERRVDAAAVALQASMDFSDICMPEELPRDEFGVKRGNFPIGVRFLRDAIRDCGGAVELDVVVQRISTLANKEVVAEFGDVREFLTIHQPTFRVHLEENDQWVVRLGPSAYPPSSQRGGLPQTAGTRKAVSSMPTTYAERHGNGSLTTVDSMCLTPSSDAVPRNVPLQTECPYCTLQLKSRNLARHMHCRRCVSMQVALGLDENPTLRGPISEMAFAAKWLIGNRESLDDHDILWFAHCVDHAAAIPKYRLSSPKKFLPILKAIRVVRDVWLHRKGLQSYSSAGNASHIADVPLDSGDAAVAEFFRVVGSNLFRLPVAWIETGDLIDMCKRFSTGTRPAHLPPPRPADPRIHLQNDFPGLLLCESEIDSEDEPSEDEAAYSDDEGEGFQFAPPVSTVETLITAGFVRDTKKLNYKLRTAPPLVHSRVLRGDNSQTHSEVYAAAAAERTNNKPLEGRPLQRSQQANGGEAVVAHFLLAGAEEGKRVTF